MKKIFIFINAVALISVSVFANATENKKPVSQWDCEDFLAVDESFKPTAVSFAEVLNKKDKPEDAILDINGTEKATPMIIEACKQAPKDSFVDKVRTEWEKVK